MGFILKIYFLGLIALVPSQDGKRVTVLLVDAHDGFHASDGSAFPPHYPALLARAAHCQGNCTQELATTASHLYSTTPDPVIPSSSNPPASLQSLVGGGGVWSIENSEVSIEHAPGAMAPPTSGSLQIVADRRGASGRGAREDMPRSARSTQDFSWVAEMAKAQQGSGIIDPDCLAPSPQKGLVAGRMKLTEGTLRSYKLAAFLPSTGGGGVAKFVFKPLAAGSQPAAATPGYSQALADWTAVEIPIAGCQVTLRSRSFDGSTQDRTMTLSPETCNGKGAVEVAMVNLPDPSRRSEREAHDHGTPQGLGTHFELFYELSKDRPAWRQRAIPQVTGEYLPPAQIGQDREPSPMLKELGVPRAGTYSLPICPQAVFLESQ